MSDQHQGESDVPAERHPGPRKSYISGPNVKVRGARLSRSVSKVQNRMRSFLVERKLKVSRSLIFAKTLCLLAYHRNA